MNKNWIWPLIAGVLLVLVPAATSSAEIKLQITISGDIGELIEVLQKLRDLGIGATIESSSAELSQIQLHSVTDVKAIGKAAAPPPPEPEEIGLAFLWAKPDPKLASAGGSVLIQAALSDPWREVETIEATLKGGNFSFDLFDKGERGDRVARDGIWSKLLNLPEPADARNYSVRIVAYDKNGDVVTVENEQGEAISLVTETSFEVGP